MAPRPLPAESDAMFPFVLPWDDAAANIADVSGWLERPAGAKGFITARDGHLYAGDKRFRIFGVNLCFGANFPTKEDAERIAARMAKFGINCVRFHHMDMFKAPDGIFTEDGAGLDPKQVDKLDYLIAQLKQRGIYANINLHVSRTYPGMPEWKDAPSFFKGVDLFYPPMLDMQREYAREILTHKNPYTGYRYAEEPAVAIVEINNENGLILEWWNGALDNMPEAYAGELRKRWREWLSKRYPSAEAWEQAWRAGEKSLGNEMLTNGGFSSGTEHWLLEQHGVAKASTQVDRDEGRAALKLETTKAGAEAWHIQLGQSRLSFDAATTYTLRFRAKADKNRRISVAASQAESPWEQLWSMPISLSPEWRDYQFVFTPESSFGNGRIVFSGLGAGLGACWFSDVSLKPGGVIGIEPGEALESAPLLKKGQFGSRTKAARLDWMEFLWETEAGYWTSMQQFLKEELKTKSLIVGTAVGFSPSPIQALLDVVDSHAYWQHPHFPGRAWDSRNWTVNNIPMAGTPDGGTLPDLALRRVAGKPYICTEYNASAPNTYSSEAYLLANAYGALQDWDGIFAFAYSHRGNSWDLQRIPGFFDIDQHPAKMVTLPAAVALFVRGDVAPAKEEILTQVTNEEAVQRSTRSGSWWRADSSDATALRSRVAISSEQSSEQPGGKTAGAIVSDTEELTWNIDERCVIIDTPRSKAFVGKVGDPVRFGNGGLVLQLGKNTQDWAAITLTAMSEDVSVVRWLVTATGAAVNTGMKWTDEKKSSVVGGNWGSAPSLVEGIPAEIRFPQPAGRVKAWALDERGGRRAEIPMKGGENGAAVLKIGPEYKTLWYEVEVSR